MNHPFELNISAMIDCDVAIDIIRYMAEEQTGKIVEEIVPLIIDGDFAGFRIRFKGETAHRTHSGAVPKTGFVPTTWS